uniref:M-poneratoxin-Dq3a n=1 Tax=Dinoponera quadriceps TaxID=609295 RepID=TXM3A_DINQU|nr:RecName: Full=M-poneratoxin-Dq3a; Short=M-PONTX-Dq3a; AltName: Full=Dinoponeratoxin; Short=DnTx; AltName: Full=Peptide sDq-2561; AltName: Full=U-poneritoxin(01)-Dq6a; Short=PONTX(01)-Dq6; Short=U-PONTX(01)-Dq6a; Contains: RecName: Full=M-poneratoxin-Dq3b; Short=M-PONTX-Dq3b; AltName: Full=Peptide sDq-1503; Contains: RecName: Full=M-poneratoxin-Dq3c; Short=M-PONTX-Dq3c; AltName: Full=Peptide sDq-1319; Flags: Precursor [Dinoponera quadriceps]
MKLSALSIIFGMILVMTIMYTKAEAEAEAEADADADAKAEAEAFWGTLAKWALKAIPAAMGMKQNK